MLSCLLSTCHSSLTAWTPSFDCSHSRFAVKNPFLLPITQRLGIAVAAKERFFEGGAELLLETGLRSTCGFCCAHVCSEPPGSQRERHLGVPVAALVDENIQRGEAPMRRFGAPGSPLGVSFGFGLRSACTQTQGMSSKSC